MTDPKWARTLDDERGRYYIDPKGGPMLPSVTNIISKGTGLKGPALIGWAVKVTAEHAWRVLPRMVLAARGMDDCRPKPIPDDYEPCAKCWGCVMRELKTRHDVVRETASGLGTRVHALAEAHMTGAVMAEDPEAEPYVEQYRQFLTDFSVDIDRDVIMAEATVLNREDGYAGTLDLITVVTIGGKRYRCLIDAKTSQTKPDTTTYKDWRLQLVALRRAKKVLLPDDSEIDMPEVDMCVTLNLRTNSYAFIPQPAGDYEYRAFLGALTVTDWAANGEPDGKPILPDGSPRPRRTRGPRKATPTTPTTGKAAWTVA